jgi:molybdopterin converting factor subunit 1
MSAVRVLLFARVRDLAGVDLVELSLGTDMTVEALRRSLAANFPEMADILPRCAIAIDGAYADDDSPIPPNAELAVIPPVSGGS